MAKFQKSDFRPAGDRIMALPKDRRDRIFANAGRLLEAQHLAEIRKALSETQTSLAGKTGLKQAEVSRIENNPETVQLRTMERYVRGLGGRMTIVAEFPDGTRAEVPFKHGKPVRAKLRAVASDKVSAPPKNQA